LTVAGDRAYPAKCPIKKDEAVKQSDSQPRRPGIAAATLVALVIDLGLLAWFVYLTTSVRATFCKIFDDFGADLPRISQWICAQPDALFVGLLGAVAAVLVLKELIVRNPSVNLAINIVAGLAILAAREVFMTAMWLPLVGLIEALSG
jgi:hypothetical protein